MKKYVGKALSLILFVSIFVQPSIAQDAAAAEALSKQFQTGAAELSDYNTACYLALSGNKKLALTYLKKAVSDGWSNTKTLLADTDLNSLHNESEWATLVKQVQENESGGNKRAKLFFNQNTFWESTSFKTPYKENISDEEKVAGLSKFWSEAKYNFVNFDLVPSLSIDSLYFEYLPKVKSTKSTLEYFYVMAEMCAKLKDAHTNVSPPAELRNEIYARPLLRSRLIEDKVLVILADKSIEDAGIKKGMEILAVNGLPVKEYAEKFIAPYESASTPQDLRVRMYDFALFSGSLNKPIQLQLKDATGRSFEKTISRVTPAERSRKFSMPSAEYKELPGKIGYLTINTFGNDSGTKVFKANYQQIAQTNGLVIDLRNNGGGSTDLTILGYIIDSAMAVTKTYSRQYISAYRAWGRPQTVWASGYGVGPTKDGHYSKPVVVLISARTFSAAEDFASACKSSKKAVLMGEATGGSTGQPLFFTLPGNMSARICTKRDQLASGEDFVGKGVQPDVIVAPTVNGIRKGIDEELEAAIREIKKAK